MSSRKHKEGCLRRGLDARAVGNAAVQATPCTCGLLAARRAQKAAKKATPWWSGTFVERLVGGRPAHVVTSGQTCTSTWFCGDDGKGTTFELSCSLRPGHGNIHAHFEWHLSGPQIISEKPVATWRDQCGSASSTPTSSSASSPAALPTRPHLGSSASAGAAPSFSTQAPDPASSAALPAATSPSASPTEVRWPTVQKVVCKRCNGDGRIVWCTACGGSGWVTDVSPPASAAVAPPAAPPPVPAPSARPAGDPPQTGAQGPGLGGHEAHKDLRALLALIEAAPPWEQGVELEPLGWKRGALKTEVEPYDWGAQLTFAAKGSESTVEADAMAQLFRVLSRDVLRGVVLKAMEACVRPTMLTRCAWGARLPSGGAPVVVLDDPATVGVVTGEGGAAPPKPKGPSPEQIREALTGVREPGDGLTHHRLPGSVCSCGQPGCQKAWRR